MSRRLVPLICVLLLGACATAGGSRPLAETTARLSMHDFMKQVINPAADTVFAAGNEDEDAKPSPEAAAAKWKQTLEAAGVIQESGRLLLLAPRARPEPDWTAAAQVMVDAGAEASVAAAARDVNAAFEAGGKLYESCNGCHSKFIHGKT